MSRYVLRERLAPDGSWDDPLLPHLYVDGPEYTDTGLLNKDGKRLFRQQPPVGFGHHKEW